MKPARIIILNGVSSVGKSSIAKAIQANVSRPFLYVPGDAFLKMPPETMMNHPDGISVRTAPDQSLAIEFGDGIARLMRGMRRSVSALASQGNHLIVDDIMMNATDQEDYRDLLEAHEVSFVGLFAPIEVLEQREANRKNRLSGLARWQHCRVHHGIVYDLKVDTSGTSPGENARAIIQALRL